MQSSKIHRVQKLCMLLCLLFSALFLTACQSNIEPEDTAQAILDTQTDFALTLTPEFSWSAFLRFWHRGADPRVSLDGATKEASGYFLDYGSGVTLFVHTKNDLVSGVTATFLARPENNDGGQQFIRLSKHMQLQGTFRWSHAARQDLFTFFDIMTESKKEYARNKSYFLRQYTAPIWTFHWFFVQEIPQLLTKQ